jgi:hypothetical protein
MKCNWKADGRLPLHALFGIFRSVFGYGFILGGDPARQFDWWNRFLQRVNSCEAMPAVEYLEAVRRAKEDYRAWYLCVFLDVGDGGVKPPFRIMRDVDSWVEVIHVKQDHLAYQQASILWDECIRKGDAFVLPVELADRRKGVIQEVTLPVLIALVMDRIIRPSRLINAMSNPKVKHLFRHGWKHRSSFVDGRHDGVLNSQPNADVDAQIPAPTKPESITD